MNRSQMTSSRVLSIPERVDKWSSNIHPNRLEESLQATVTLLKNITNPILAISLIMYFYTHLETKLQNFKVQPLPKYSKKLSKKFKFCAQMLSFKI